MNIQSQIRINSLPKRFQEELLRVHAALQGTITMSGPQRRQFLLAWRRTWAKETSPTAMEDMDAIDYGITWYWDAIDQGTANSTALDQFLTSTIGEAYFSRYNILPAVHINQGHSASR